MISPKFIDHLVFRISALDRSERFYTALLSQHPERTEQSLLYTVGDTRLFFTLAAEPRSGTYDKEQIGLNHIAFGIDTLADLQAVEQQLSAAGIAHSGIKIDQYGLKEYIWLNDPDGIRIEFYLRPQS
ncbi:VOC family protein [Granulicella sp. L46]|jgi:glyoxylase I family protein|uniref:VOC family protein n=1 Tax=Granulicella sp. L46 TaxID=1641865 RepID=UPI00131A6397|nr:VOC family protein [Granulicella sp. L46]